MNINYPQLVETIAYSVINDSKLDYVNSKIPTTVSLGQFIKDFNINYEEYKTSKRVNIRFRKVLELFGITFENKKTLIIPANLSYFANRILPLSRNVTSDVLDNIYHHFSSSRNVRLSQYVSMTDDEFANTIITCAKETRDKVKNRHNKNIKKYESNITDCNSIDINEDVDINEKPICLSNTEQYESTIHALRKELRDAYRLISKYKLDCGNQYITLERIKEISNVFKNELSIDSKVWKSNNKFNGISSTAVLHVSDWHIGEMDDVNGFNKFNYDVACERIKLLVEKYLSWIETQRHAYNIEELVIISTGDMISGDIHEELLRTNEFSVPMQCTKATMLFSKMVNDLSKHFKSVRVEYIVSDNHSRTTKKMQFGDGTNSYNYIVAKMIEATLLANDSVHMNVYAEIEHIIKVENIRYLIMHGNNVRGGASGVPLSAIQKRANSEALARMNMDKDKQFNKIVMGHYHVPLYNNFVEMTGCLSGTTSFDQSQGRYCNACQTGWLVTRNHEVVYSVFDLS